MPVAAMEQPSTIKPTSSGKKMRTVAICGLVILAAAGAGYSYVHHASKNSSSTGEQSTASKTYIDESLATITKVGRQPTEDYKLPDGKYTKVMARQLILGINNADTVKSFGGNLIAVSHLPQTYILTVPVGKALDQAAAEAKKKPGVAYAEVSNILMTSGVGRTVPNDPKLNNTKIYEGQREYLLDISAPEGWSIATAGAGIAIIDTGIQSDHPDLADRLQKNTGEVPGNGVDDDSNGYIDDYYGMDFVNGCNGTTAECPVPTSDADGAEDDSDRAQDDGHKSHGTAVAGIAAAHSNNAIGIAGISWDSRILAVKVSNQNGASSDVSVAQAIRYAASQPGIRVINVSSGRDCVPANTDCTEPYMKEAIDFAITNRVVVVAAAGNSSSGTTDSVETPASYAPVIATGATDTATSPPIWNAGSKYGKSGPQVDLSAPFYPYTTTMGGGYADRAGTSFTAPQIAGAAALMLKMKPGLTPAQVSAILKATADPSVDKKEVGAGRLNLYKALKYTHDCVQ